mmetsp:Transcript_38035/g.109713  ORF Transcript_38035/g.109713 Transcript_38035/m.109713 type:complete len:401 (-) Transcript_38035:425-1627(-)
MRMRDDARLLDGSDGWVVLRGGIAVNAVQVLAAGVRAVQAKLDAVGVQHRHHLEDISVEEHLRIGAARRQQVQQTFQDVAARRFAWVNTSADEDHLLPGENPRPLAVPSARWRGGLWLGLVFAAGAAVGAFRRDVGAAVVGAAQGRQPSPLRLALVAMRGQVVLVVVAAVRDRVQFDGPSADGSRDALPVDICVVRRQSPGHVPHVTADAPQWVGERKGDVQSPLFPMLTDVPDRAIEDEHVRALGLLQSCLTHRQPPGRVHRPRVGACHLRDGLQAADGEARAGQALLLETAEPAHAEPHGLAQSELPPHAEVEPLSAPAVLLALEALAVRARRDIEHEHPRRTCRIVLAELDIAQVAGIVVGEEGVAADLPGPIALELRRQGRAGAVVLALAAHDVVF